MAPRVVQHPDGRGASTPGLPIPARGTPDPDCLIDEVGIAYGRFGDLVLKSCYQPLYCVEGDWLQPFGVEALVTGLRGKVAIGADEILGLVEGEQRVALERLCRILHVRNYHNMGLPGMQLFFNADPGFTVEDVEHLGWLLAEEGVAPELVTCEITEQAGNDGRLRILADELRAIGVQTAVDDFGAGHSTAARVRALRPDTVKIDAHWFRSVVSHPRALDLLPSLFSRLNDFGCRILVEGIETPGQLHAAISAGADLLQGYLLARPALAGTIIDESSLLIRDLLPDAKPAPRA